MSSCLMCNKVVNGISQSPDTGLIQFSDSLALRQLPLALMLLQGRLVGLSAVSCRSPAAVFSAGQAVGVQPPVLCLSFSGVQRCWASGSLLLVAVELSLVPEHGP